MRALSERAPLALLGIILCVLGAGLGLLLLNAKTRSSQALQWEPNIEHALHVAREKRQPTVLLVTMPRCAACAHLERETLAHRSVRKALKHFVLARYALRPDEYAVPVGNASVAIAGTPTLLFFDADAQLQASPRLEGYFSPQTFLRVLAQSSDRLYAPAARVQEPSRP